MIQLRRLWLTDFRNYRDADLSFAAGTTAIVGGNGQGKTNLVEALAYLGGVSLRGARAEHMVASWAQRAIVRSELSRGERDVLVEAEMPRTGRDRLLLNRQPVRRRSDLADGLVVTIFSPDDLELVKGGPGARRRFLDDAVVALDPRVAQPRAEFEKALRQRNAMLRQVGGRLDDAAATTLDVWDDRMARAGTELIEARRVGMDVLGPQIDQAYRDISGEASGVVSAELDGSESPLHELLADHRVQDLRRGVSTVGPHRDEVVLEIDGRPSRTHASQGEQRSLALALKLAVHRAVADRLGHAPVLLLDDVCSELDESRTARLLAHLPAGQTLLTSATELPSGARPDRVVRVEAGRAEVVA